MLWVFHVGRALFRSGWFVESLTTQTLVIFAIRARRIPFFGSHPSVPLLVAAVGMVIVGAVLPATPLAHALGFQPLPGLFYLALTLMVASYLVLIEIGKTLVLPHRALGPRQPGPHPVSPATPPRSPLHHRKPARLPRPVPASEPGHRARLRGKPMSVAADLAQTQASPAATRGRRIPAAANRACSTCPARAPLLFSGQPQVSPAGTPYRRENSGRYRP
jgi:hypothetical protein